MIDWEAVGAVGEILGAAAVVVTLLYLARETRTNSKLIEMQAGRQISFHLSSMYNDWWRDPEAMKVISKSHQDPIADFTTEEWAQLNYLFMTYLHAIEAQYISQSTGLGFKEQDDGYLRAARTVFANWPAWRKMWEAQVANDFWPAGLVEELSRDDVGNLDSFSSPSEGNS